MTDQIMTILIERVNQLEKENVRLATRIERLEEGRRLLIERSHDHQRQIQRLEDKWAAEHEDEPADLAQEKYEQQMDEEADCCPRCGQPYKDTPLGVAVGGDLCCDCESELAEEQAELYDRDCDWDPLYGMYEQ